MLRYLLFFALITHSTTSLRAQHTKHEVAVSWMPMIDGDNIFAAQLAYFRHLLPWYHLGGSIFRFGTKPAFNTPSQLTQGITLVSRFTTAEHYKFGISTQVGITYFSTDNFGRFGGVLLIPARDKVLGNIWNVSIFGKPHKRLRISSGFNLYTSAYWFTPPGPEFYLEPVTISLEATAAWQF
jgi:hypothetical protein